MNLHYNHATFENVRNQKFKNERQGSAVKKICTSEARKPFFICGFLPEVT